MKKRKMGPLLLALALGTGAGCQRHLAQAANPTSNAPAGVPAASAPVATPPVLAGAPAIATLVAKVTPGVVNITTTHDIRGVEPNFDFPFGFDPFGMFPQMRRPRGGNGGGGGQVFRQRALGSGFIIDAAGHVVTNAHVVEEADQVRVKLSDEREFDAKV